MHMGCIGHYAIAPTTVIRLKLFQPLYLGDKGCCERVLEEAQLPLWEGYKRGLCRTACRICPGQRPRAYAAMRREYPDVWNELLWLESRLGPGLWQKSFAGEDANPTFEEAADKGETQLEE